MMDSAYSLDPRGNLAFTSLRASSPLAAGSSLRGHDQLGVGLEANHDGRPDMLPLDATNSTGGAAWLMTSLLISGLGLSAMRHRRQRRKAGARGARARTTAHAQMTLQEGIADMYDAASAVWVELWGEHLHHGYYPEGFKGNMAQHRAAQVDMIERTLEWAGVPEKGEEGCPQTVLDVGCGVGGSSRHLQHKYGAKTLGITLSPKQRDLAQSLSEARGQGEMCSFQVADALKMPFPDNSFDLVWSMESGEHMPNKPEFMRQLHRVCKPGGRIILVTWVHRDLEEGEDLKRHEKRLLSWINKAYHLPRWVSLADYVEIAKGLGFENMKIDDWTKNIMPFWGAVIRSAFTPKGWWALWNGGWQTLKGALVMPLMSRGYNMGTIKFGLLTATKAAEGGEAAASSGGAKTATNALPVFSSQARPRGARYSPEQPAFAGSFGSNALSQKLFPGSRTASSGVAASSGSSLFSSSSCLGGNEAGSSSAPRFFRSKLARRAATTLKEQAHHISSSQGGVSEALRTVWDFSRPHTLVGTMLSVPSVMMFAAAPQVAQHGLAAVAPKLLGTVLFGLVPGLCVNLYITGLNQIYDVDIDRVNKPYLPIPAGRLSLEAAGVLCMAALGLVAAWSFWNLDSGSWPLRITFAVSALLGTVYSMPPFRLKRWPTLAALSIITVRGLLVNVGFYCFAMEALGLAKGFACLDARALAAAAYFAVFGLVISLMKDVPDILGDKIKGIESLSVQLGPETMLSVATGVLYSLLTGTMSIFGFGAVQAFQAGATNLGATRAALGLAALYGLQYVVGRRSGVEPTDAKGVYDFYMDVWKVFYASYLCLPFVQ
mmetsp:Transcript_47746/g.102334  ORF Transcript_47746/g.102334 Transcript_47746/m.102334 type:complete len:830 (-) Transcript_47746:38-2527(-)